MQINIWVAAGNATQTLVREAVSLKAAKEAEVARVEAAIAEAEIIGVIKGGVKPDLSLGMGKEGGGIDIPLEGEVIEAETKADALARDDSSALREVAYAKLSRPQQKAVEVLRKTHDGDVVSSLFKSPTFDGKTWTLYSLYPADVESVDEAVKDAVTTFGDDILVLGAWTLDGYQVGTYRDEEGELQGTPTHPIHAKLLAFMPDRWDAEIEQLVAATEVSDVNFLGGQSPRQFA